MVLGRDYFTSLLASLDWRRAIGGYLPWALSEADDSLHYASDSLRVSLQLMSAQWLERTHG